MHPYHTPTITCLMNEITRIQAALRPHLSWQGARLRVLALFLVSLFPVEKVNLHKLASVFANQAQSAVNWPSSSPRSWRGRGWLVWPDCSRSPKGSVCEHA